MPGHVFVVRGDLTVLCCDEWLVPTDKRLRIKAPWVEHLRAGEGAPFTPPTPSAGWESGAIRSFCPPDWPSGPRPWLTRVGRRGAKISWYQDGARDFVLRAARALRPAPLNGRERHLLALPVVGTRLGGGRHQTGEILRALLELLYDLTRDPGLPPFDVALVTFDDTHFAAAQRQRRRLQSEGAFGVWAELERRLVKPAVELAGFANRQRLALFLGAGVSIGAGAPSWAELLDQMAAQAGITGAELRRFRELSFHDRAALVELRLQRRASIKQLAAQLVDRQYASLTHFLLAGLPVCEVVTTNYDDLFERASASICDVSVLPHRPQPKAPRWILKLHGCISDPASIVLTRQDYLRYAQHRQALAGIVQALLITRRLLFVGFGLGDDNFHRIADEVRRAYPHGERIGTNVVIEDHELQRQLWEGDLDWVSVRREGDDLRHAARRLEIFLDRVLAGVDRAPAHLLDPTFEGVLEPGEVKLRGALDGLAGLLADPDVRRDAPGAIREIEALLARLGSSGQR
jgi:hypothetical protein